MQFVSIKFEIALVSPDILGFKALGAETDPIAYGFAFFKRLKIYTIELGIMEEDIFTGRVVYKTKTSTFDQARYRSRRHQGPSLQSFYALHSICPAPIPASSG